MNQTARSMMQTAKSNDKYREKLRKSFNEFQK